MKKKRKTMSNCGPPVDPREPRDPAKPKKPEVRAQGGVDLFGLRGASEQGPEGSRKGRAGRSWLWGGLLDTLTEIKPKNIIKTNA